MITLYTVPEIPEPHKQCYDPRSFEVRSASGVLFGHLRQDSYFEPFHYVQFLHQGHPQYHGVIIMRYILEQMEKANRLLNSKSDSASKGSIWEGADCNWEERRDY